MHSPSQRRLEQPGWPLFAIGWHLLWHHCTRPHLKPWAPTPQVLRRRLFQPRLQTRCWRFPRLGLVQCPQLAVLPIVHSRVEFPCVCVGDHSRSPPHLCLPMHEGSVGVGIDPGHSLNANAGRSVCGNERLYCKGKYLNANAGRWGPSQLGSEQRILSDTNLSLWKRKTEV
jgi:hypothetical protein